MDLVSVLEAFCAIKVRLLPKLTEPSQIPTVTLLF